MSSELVFPSPPTGVKKQNSSFQVEGYPRCPMGSLVTPDEFRATSLLTVPALLPILTCGWNMWESDHRYFLLLLVERGIRGVWGGRVISARNLGVIRAFNATGSFAHAMLGEEACCTGKWEGSRGRSTLRVGGWYVRCAGWAGGSGPGVLHMTGGWYVRCAGWAGVHMTRAVCWVGGRGAVRALCWAGGGEVGRACCT